MVDTNTIDSAESLKQLRVTARRSFNTFSKASKRVMKKKIFDRGSFLQGVFTALRFGESAYQKSKAQFVRMMADITRGIAQQIQNNPQGKEMELAKISRLKELLVKLDQEQAIERRKADMMTRWIRGTYSEVAKIESQMMGVTDRYSKLAQKEKSKFRQKQEQDQGSK